MTPYGWGYLVERWIPEKPKDQEIRTAGPKPTRRGDFETIRDLQYFELFINGLYDISIVV
jgi:hypothetical protein